MKRLQDIDVKGQRVLTRFDLNVPFDDIGGITETTRIERVKPTVDYLLDNGAKLIVLAHLGRPKDDKDPRLSLLNIVEACEKIWRRNVHFVPDIAGEKAQKAVALLQPGQILLLENLRYDKGEEANDPAFAKRLAALGDVFVNDAFSVSHRAHASTEGLAKLLPSAPGLSMQAELDALSQSVENPKRPVLGIIGGSKVSTKLAVLEHLFAKLDALIIGGGMANTFLLAQGHDIGGSLAEADLTGTAKDILKKAQKAGCRIILPIDVTATLSLDAPTEIYRGALKDMPKDCKIVDIGADSVAMMESEIAKAATMLWNGPVGVFEKKPFDTGTAALARAIAANVKNGGVAVAGGGDTLAAIEAAGLSEKDFTFLSTAGGAFLEWLEGKELPGVAALNRN